MTGRDIRRRRSGITPVKLLIVIAIIVGGLLFVVSVIAVLAALLVPKLMDTKERAKMAQCTVNLRNLHLACMQYADTENFYPGSGGTSNPGLQGIKQLINTGYLSQMKTVICPSSVDSLKTLGASLSGGSVNPGQEQAVANALTYSLRPGDPMGTCSYYFTAKTIPQSSMGGRPICVDANHNARDAIGTQFNGAAAEADNHAAGFQVLTNDGAIEFVRLKKIVDAAKIKTTKAAMDR